MGTLPSSSLNGLSPGEVTFVSLSSCMKKQHGTATNIATLNPPSTLHQSSQLNCKSAWIILLLQAQSHRLQIWGFQHWHIKPFSICATGKINFISLLFPYPKPSTLHAVDMQKQNHSLKHTPNSSTSNPPPHPGFTHLQNLAWTPLSQRCIFWPPQSGLIRSPPPKCHSTFKIHKVWC